VNAQFFGGHFCASDTVRYFLKSDIARLVRTTVIGLLVDAERREAAIVSRAEALLVDTLGRGNQLITHLLCGFCPGALCDDTADI
jgi:hypothetical protein